MAWIVDEDDLMAGRSEWFITKCALQTYKWIEMWNDGRSARSETTGSVYQSTIFLYMHKHIEYTCQAAYLIEQRRYRIEDTDIDAIGHQQQYVVTIRDQSVHRVQERRRFVAGGHWCVGCRSRWRRWFTLENYISKCRLGNETFKSPLYI